MKEKHAIWKLIEQKNSIKTAAQKLGISNTTTWNILKNKPLVYLAIDNGKVGQGKQLQLMTEISSEL